jgi:hypothetical protein
MKTPMMKCGCAAQGTIQRWGETEKKPGCIVHECTDVAETEPDLSQRMARCGCGRTEPSSPNLAFFEFTGEGSRTATETCECGYNRTAHTDEIRGRNEGVCATFKPQGAQRFDRFYCGCRGWD